MPIAGVQRLLGIGNARILVNLVLAVVVFIGGTVLPTELGLHGRGLQFVCGILLIVDVYPELIAKALGITVRRPGKYKTVVLLLHHKIVYWYRAYYAYRHCSFRIIALSILIPELRDIVNLISWRRLVHKTVVCIGSYIVIELCNLFTVAIDHPLKIVVITRNSIHIPRQFNFLLGLVKYCGKVFCLNNGRIDSNSLTDDRTVIRINESAD